MLFIEYPKCATCIKAKSWLDDNGIIYDDRSIISKNPTYEELKKWHGLSGLPLKKFFNTSGKLYRDNKIKDRLDKMSDEDMLMLLSTDGLLVKRPLIISDEFVLVGFNEEKWRDALI